jgi:hypothetical protein
MKRSRIIAIHTGTSALAMITVVTFFTSTLIIEFSGSVEEIAALKENIFFALPLMLVTMPLVGLSGKKLAGKSRAPLVQRKLKRMKLIAINGFMLITLATLLYVLSRDLRLDTAFYLLQGLELLLGAVNISLMVLSVRDGMLLSGRLRKKQKNSSLSAKKVESSV